MLNINQIYTKSIEILVIKKKILTFTFSKCLWAHNLYRIGKRAGSKIL